MKRRVVYRHGRCIEVIDTSLVVTPRKLSATIKFVQVPAFWIEKLATQHGRVYDVALLLLQLDFKHRGHPVKLSNEITRHLKLNRRVKYRVLVKLEKLGLISVLHRPGAAPEITITKPVPLE
jgi:hypothetical protein